MAAYIVAHIEVTDPARYEEYRRQVAATITQYGGRFLVRGGATEVLEGSLRPGRVVILEFASIEQAKTWWDSPEYRRCASCDNGHRPATCSSSRASRQAKRISAALQGGPRLAPRRAVLRSRERSSR